MLYMEEDESDSLSVFICQRNAGSNTASGRDGLTADARTANCARMAWLVQSGDRATTGEKANDRTEWYPDI